MVDTNRVKGALDKAKGAIKEGAGSLTGDEKCRPKVLQTRLRAKPRAPSEGLKMRFGTPPIKPDTYTLNQAAEIYQTFRSMPTFWATIC